MNNKYTIETRFTRPDGWQWRWIKSADRTMLRTGSSLADKNSRIHVVYVEGLSEFAEKSFELARDFNRNSMNFHVMDRKGQGLSGRYLNDRFKIHAADFQNDADDLITMIRDTIPEDESVFLLGHSTGGLIALMGLHDNPDLFDGAILTAPLLGFHDIGIRGRERLVSHLNLPGLNRMYIPGGCGWNPDRIEKNREILSSDPKRSNLKQHWMAVNPALRTGSPTIGWAANAARAMVEARQEHYLENIKKPVMLISAGKDTIVDNEAIRRASHDIPGSVYIHVNDSRHELLMERDEIRTPLLDFSMSFIRKHSSPDSLRPT